MSDFLAQIDFMKEWNPKELLNFANSMKIVKFLTPGTIVMEEQQGSEFVAIVREGQFEISRSNLKDIYINTESHRLQIKTSKGIFLNS